MARTISAPQSLSYGTVNQGTHKQVLTYNYYISSNDYADYYEYAYKGWGYAYGPSYSFDDWVKFVNPPGTLWMNNRTMNADCDRNVYVRHYGEWKNDVGGLTYTKTVNAGPYLTWAVDPTVGTCTPGSATKTSITVSGMSWIPATYDTGVSIKLQYKATSSGTWLTFSTLQSGQTGYSTLYPSNTVVTGLTPDTPYHFRLWVDRTGTANTTTQYYGATSSTLSTLPNNPEITTNDAYNVGTTTADMSAYVVPNGFSCTLSWRYHTSNPGTPNDTSGTEAAYPSNPVTVTGTYSRTITGLTSETQYWYWAILEYTDGGTQKIYGAIKTFTTGSTPGDYAEDQSRMFPYVFHRKRGEILTGKPLVFALHTPAATNSDTFVASLTLATGDVKISKDGAAAVNTTNLPTHIVNGIYKLELTAAELDCAEADIVIHDASATVFRDTHLRVVTHFEVGSFEANATGAGNTLTNKDGFKAVGKGTGYGMLATGGTDQKDIGGTIWNHTVTAGTAQGGASSYITLATTASATADAYNGMIVTIISGPGYGESRTITDFATSRQATVDKNWLVTPTSSSVYVITNGRNIWDELEGTAPSNADWGTNLSFRKIMQFMKRRWFNKSTQTASNQVVRNDGDTADLVTRAVTDNGTIQTQDAVS